MVSTLNKQEWGMKLGLSATEIGQNWRVIIAMGNAYINPQFTPSKAPLETIIESSYSLGKRKFKVQRAKYGWLKWQDIKGEWQEKKISGLEAVVIQHEIDYLDGISCSEKGEEIFDNEDNKV